MQNPSPAQVGLLEHPPVEKIIEEVKNVEGEVVVEEEQVGASKSRS